MEQHLQLVGDILIRAWTVLGAMSPWVLGGFLVAGILSLWLNARFVREHFGGGRAQSILKAVALGIPLPVCSCGVIPLSASLRRHGAGKGATAAFLMSTPQTGVDSIAVTYGLMGPLFAVLRPLAALVSGVVGGLAVDATDRQSPPGSLPPDPVLETDSRPWWQRIWHNGFIVLPRSVGGATIAGALISGIVMAMVPDNWVASHVANPYLQMALTIAIGVPVYICSTAAVPFALGLLSAGLSPGAAMAFLIAGPGVSASTLLAIWKLMGRKTTLVYLAVLTSCAVAFGVWVNHLLPSGWMPLGIQRVSEHVHCEGGAPWFVHVRAALLLGVVWWARHSRPAVSRAV